MPKKIDAATAPSTPPDYATMDRQSRRLHAAHAHLAGRAHPDSEALAEMAAFAEELELVQALSGYDSYAYAQAQNPAFVDQLRAYLRAQRLHAQTASDTATTA